MNPTPLKQIDESLVEFNRIRYKNELAQGIYDLMQTQAVNHTALAGLLGVEKSRISHILSGDKNLQADTLADVLLVLGRTPHLILASDFDEIRFPVDEGEYISIQTPNKVQSNDPSVLATIYSKGVGATHGEKKIASQGSNSKAIGFQAASAV